MCTRSIFSDADDNWKAVCYCWYVTLVNSEFFRVKLALICVCFFLSAESRVRIPESKEK